MNWLRLGGVAAGALLCAIGCGGDDDVDGPVGPQPLVEDPAVATGCLPDPLGPGQSRAKRIACVEERPAGRLASGRIGDVVLENDRIEVVVRGFGDGFVFPGTTAGGIVDAARLGRDDQLKEIQPIVELNAGGYTEFAITEAGDDGPATFVVRGRAYVIPFIAAAINVDPVPATIELRYILEPDSDALLIRAFVFGDDGETAVVEHGEGLFFGGRVALFAPNRGFIEGGGANAEYIASAGGNGGTSYGIVYDPDHASAVSTLEIGGLALAIGPTSSIDVPDPTDRYLVVGDGSVSSVTERAWLLRGYELGTVTGTAEPGAAIAVLAGETPVTRGRADDTGAYRIALPAGQYTLHTDAVNSEEPERAVGPSADATLTAGAETTLNLTGGGLGTLSVTVSEEGAGAIPARVVASADGYRKIEFADASGAVAFNVPPGTYTVTASRGMEYDAFTATEVAVADGATVDLDATLSRVVDTAGWIAVDTHLHSEMSSDSSYPLDERLRGVAAEGVEVAVSTDHDFVTDYGPVIDEIGLADWLAGRVGHEVSSLVWGHLNVWPMPLNPDAAGGGALPWYFVSPGDVFAAAREVATDPVVQANHVRSSSSGLFNVIDFSPETGRARAEPSALGLPPETDLNDFSFDAIEVANSLSEDEITESFDDWLALVMTGHPAAATGSSDSHGRSAFSGASRTYVYVGDGADDPATVDLDAVDAAIRNRRVTIGQGAFVTAGLEVPDGGESLPGDTVDLNGQAEARLHVRVQAPPWMPLASVRVFEGRTLVTTINLDTADTASVRYDQTLTLPLSGADTFYVVQVLPAGPGDPVMGMPVMSFTNPLLVDADGDGLWTPMM